MSKTLAISDPGFPPGKLAECLALTLVLVLGGVTTSLGQVRAPADLEPPARPVAAWPPRPLEVIAAFEKPVDPAVANSMIGQTITYDDIRADRPELPAASGPAGRLRIVGARVVDDGRTLVLATDPHPRTARYLLPLPGDRMQAASKGLAISTISYDLSGAEAVWYEGDIAAGEPRWSGWWPSLDLDITRRLTRGSRLHETGLLLLARSGRLVLSTWVRLPAGKVTLRVQSTRPIEEAMLGDAQAVGHAAEPDDIFQVELTVEARGEPLFFTTTFRTGDAGRPLQIKGTYRVGAEVEGRPIERSHLLVPWAPTPTVAATAAPLAIPDLSGGDPGRGRTIFRGDQARCAQCHAIRGEGGKVGPDLTDIASKGRAEIYRSIAAPSAAIEPDYTTFTVATKDGQVLSGVVRAEGPEEIKVTDTNARTATVRRDQIQEIRPSATSIMPPGMAAALGDSAVRDLIAYLTSPAPPARSSP